MRRRTLLRIARKSPHHRPGVPHRPHPVPIQQVHVAQWYHALSDTRRLALLQLLSQRQRSAGELGHILDMPKSAVSFHLKVLKDSGLIHEQRDGPWKYIRLRPETLEHMLAFIETVQPGKHIGTCPLECCQ